MNSILSVFLLLLPTSNAVYLAGNLAMSYESQESHMREQDNAGPYIIESLDKDREKKNAAIRDFIWSHWKRRRPGRLTATWYSKEGVPSENTFMLGPDENETWSVKVTIERPTLKGTTAEHTEYRCYSMKRFILRLNGKSAHAIPDEDGRDGTRYRLVFYDANKRETGGV